MRTVITATLLLALCVLLCACAREGLGSSSDRPTDTTELAREYRFRITGMHCDACVQSITAAVTALDGVDACTVSLEDESAVVAAKVDVSGIEAAIETLGFEADQSDPIVPSQSESHD